MAEDSLKQKTKKGLFWTLLEQFANYGLAFIVGIIMARLLSPSDYGITALPSIFLEVASVFINSGFTSAMIRKPELTNKDLSTTFIYASSVGIVCYFILFFSAPAIADFYDTPILVPLVRVTALTFLWNPLTTPQNVILRRKLDFKTLSRISVTTKLIGSIIGITLAFLGHGLWSLVAMNIASSLLNLVQLSMKVRWLPKYGWSKDSFRYLWGYGNKILGSALLDHLYKNIVPVFVGKFYSPADLGIYNRAIGYAKLPSSNITGVIQQVTFPVLSKMQDDNAALARNYRKMMRVTAFIIFPIMMLLSALARPLIIILVTEKWEASIILLQLMCFSMMWYPIHSMNLNLLQVKGRSDLFFRLEVVKKAIGIVALSITLPISLIAVVLGRWITNVLFLIVNTHYTGQIIGVTFMRQMQDLLPTMGIALMMWAIVFSLTFVISNYYIQAVVGIIVGLCFYIGIAVLLNRPELDDVKYLFNRK